MASSIDNVSNTSASTDVARQAEDMPSKRKAADMNNEEDTWTPPENPIRAMADTGSINLHHRTIKSCIYRAAGHRPDVAKDLAVARLSIGAVKHLIKLMKGRRPDLDVTEHKDLMRLERKLKISKAFHSGYFGLKLKDVTSTPYSDKRALEIADGQQPYSKTWGLERKKVLAYYTQSQEQAEKFDHADWKRYESEVRADFENEKAEQALATKVEEAYKEGQERRTKRRKLALSPYETSGDDDAPTFEVSNSKVDGATKSVAATSERKDTQLECNIGEDRDAVGSHDVKANGHTETVGLQGKPPSPFGVDLKFDDYQAASSEKSPAIRQHSKSGLASIHSCSRAKTPKSHEPKRPSLLNPTFAGITKRAAATRKTSRTRDDTTNAEWGAAPSSQDGTDQLEKDITAPKVDDAFDQDAADFEAQMEAEAMADALLDAAMVASPIDPDLESCSSGTTCSTGSRGENSNSDVESAATSLSEVNSSPADEHQCGSDQDGDSELDDTVQTTAEPTNADVEQYLLEDSSDEVAMRHSSSSASLESAPSMGSPKEDAAPNPDAIDRAYFNLISRSSKKWIREVKKRIARGQD